MTTDLENSFYRFASLARSRLAQRPESRARGVLRLVPNEARELAEAVEKLEDESEAHLLVEATRDAFKGRYRGDWRWAVRTFFRRSRFYLHAWQGGPVEPEVQLFEEYCREFSPGEPKVTYLAPLEYADFDSLDHCLDFKAFNVRRFREEELEDVLGNDVNGVFYPHAELTPDEIRQLASCWFLYLSATTPSIESMRGPFDYGAMYRLNVPYTPFPGPVESAIRQLVLYDWQPDYFRHETPDRTTGWSGFSVPFVLKIHHSLLRRPARAPDVTKLSTDERDWRHSCLDRTETEGFRDFIQKTSALFERLRLPAAGDWKFIDIAVGYLTKAFFAEDLEQLLWHITALEALFGENKRAELVNESETLPLRI